MARSAGLRSTGTRRIWLTLLDRVTLLALASITPGCGAPGPPPTAGDLIGYWAGTFSILGEPVDLVIEVTGPGGAALEASLDMVERGVVDVPATSIELENDGVTINFGRLKTAFEGRLDRSGDLRGDWLQAGGKFRLVLTPVDEPPGPYRPQEPKEPFPYAVEDVAFPNEEAALRLAGTLTLPSGGGPVPAAVLVSGSGPQDRDETIFGHRPFWVIADHLTRAGVAVLRYDDRGVGASTGDFSAATTADFATDALAAVDYLKTRPEVDSSWIGVIGHSEGGWVAPIAATRSTDVSFLVLMAAVGMDGRSLLALQMDRIMTASGVPEPVRALNRAIQNEVLNAMATAEGGQAATEAAQERFRRALGGLPYRTAEALGISGGINRAIEEQLALVTSPWLSYFLTFDAVTTFQEIQVPVLALNGAIDLQVPSDPNLRLVREAIERGGNPSVTAVELRGLNHMFQQAESGLPSEYGVIEQTIEPQVLELMTDWILQTTSRPVAGSPVH